MNEKSTHSRKDEGVVCSIRREAGGTGGRAGAGLREEKPSVPGLPGQLEKSLVKSPHG